METVQIQYIMTFVNILLHYQYWRNAIAGYSIFSNNPGSFILMYAVWDWHYIFVIIMKSCLVTIYNLHVFVMYDFILTIPWIMQYCNIWTIQLTLIFDGVAFVPRKGLDCLQSYFWHSKTNTTATFFYEWMNKCFSLSRVCGNLYYLLWTVFCNSALEIN